MTPEQTDTKAGTPRSTNAAIQAHEIRDDLMNGDLSVFDCFVPLPDAQALERELEEAKRKVDAAEDRGKLDPKGTEARVHTLLAGICMAMNRGEHVHAREIVGTFLSQSSETNLLAGLDTAIEVAKS